MIIKLDIYAASYASSAIFMLDYMHCHNIKELILHYQHSQQQVLAMNGRRNSETQQYVKCTSVWWMV